MTRRRTRSTRLYAAARKCGLSREAILTIIAAQLEYLNLTRGGKPQNARVH
jgi:hypothetical protein